MVTLLSYHPKYQMFLKFFPFKGGRFDPSTGRHPQSRGYQHTTYTLSLPGTGVSSFRFYPKVSSQNSEKMEPFKIQIEVGFNRETLDVLRQLAPDMPAEVCNCSAHHDLKTEVEEIVVDFLRRLQDHAKKPVEEPKLEENSGKVEQPAPEAPAEAAPAPAPEKTSDKEITDADLRQAVKAAKDKVGTPVVKALFAEFEIPNSSACPQERRGELMDRLEKLAA